MRSLGSASRCPRETPPPGRGSKGPRGRAGLGTAWPEGDSF